jgi:hypothetical protein
LKGNVFPLGIEEHLLSKGTLLFSLLANDFTLGLIDGYVSSRVQRSIGFLVGKMKKISCEIKTQMICFTYSNFSVKEFGCGRTKFLHSIDTHDGNRQTGVEFMLHDVDFLAAQVGS